MSLLFLTEQGFISANVISRNSKYTDFCQYTVTVFQEMLFQFIYRSSRPVKFCKKVFLEILQDSQESACHFCKMSKNTFSYRTPPMATYTSTVHMIATISLQFQIPST